MVLQILTKKSIKINNK